MILETNPLFPMVKELAAKVNALSTGKLFARTSVDGPQSLDELAALLEEKGMLAASWLVSDRARRYKEMKKRCEELEDVESKLHDVAALIEKAAELLDLFDNP